MFSGGWTVESPAMCLVGDSGCSLGVDTAAGWSARLFPGPATMSLTTWVVGGEMEEGRG